MLIISENYLPFLTCLILIHFLQTPCFAHQHPKSNCNPSACGNIQEISYPFRLKHDPGYCGHYDPSYEISCENNTIASVYVDNHKYHVRAINYQNYTIRLAHPSIQIDELCSFPTYSPDWTRLRDSSSSGYMFGFSKMVWPVTLFSCPFPLNDTDRHLLVDLTNHCFTNSTSRRHTYVKAGDLKLRDIKNMCRIDLSVLSALPFDAKNVSLLKMHQSLLYGFELSWAVALCACKTDETCAFDEIVRPTCFPTYTTDRMLEMKLEILSLSVFNAALYIVWKIFQWVVGMPFFIGLVIYKLRRRHLSMFDLIEGFLQSYNNLMPIRYSYTNVKKMTTGFREKLGQGGYGSVYKGKLRSGNIVAVKVLSTLSTNGQDFINEVATMGRIHHINVIKLVGYCAEGSKCALVYDFMPNGSLEKYIYSGKTGNASLSWDRKYDIAVGVARGIEYLHRGCDIQILHFDIKPHNILLDDNFNPKISDFGLAKFYYTEKDIVTLTAARGTIGYVAPELIRRSLGGVSYKADVYSFGMLLVELVGLKRDLAANADKSSQYFPHWIYDSLNEGKDIEIEKVDDIDDEHTRKIMTRMTIVALWCIQMRPDDRPPMSKVLEMLECDAELLEIPPQPFAFDEQVMQNEDQTWETYSSDSTALLGDGSSLGQEV